MAIGECGGKRHLLEWVSVQVGFHSKTALAMCDALGVKVD